MLQQYDNIWVQQEPPADPLRVLAALAKQPHTQLLHSADRDHPDSRWSLLVADPFMTITAKGGRITVAGETLEGDPFQVLKQHLQRFSLTRPEGAENLPPFLSGAVGFFGYELAHHVENLPRMRDDQNLPDMALGFYDSVLAFDMKKGRTLIIATGLGAEDKAARAQAEIRKWQQILAAPPKLEAAPPRPQLSVITSNFTPEEYKTAVARAIEYIHAGDIFQTTLSQRFDAKLLEPLSGFDIYRSLIALSPAPFAAYLNFGGFEIISNSPERFIQCTPKNGALTVEACPIKGTSPRGATPEEDAWHAAELAASEKDRAENVMIVDLLRNDLSITCQDHSITVPVLCALETFANVHHLVSTVRGTLREGLGPVDLLKPAFPGGSVTGAPKVRAMQIIAELEPTSRGPYCGAIGYIGFDGAMDLNIAIRTLIKKDNDLSFQSGGGIVADSEPETEYRETLTKASAILAALTGSDMIEAGEETAPPRKWGVHA